MTSETDPVAEDQLLAGHATADHLFKALIDSVRHGDQAAIVDHFRKLEQALLDHMAEEERELFPAYQLVDPDDAAFLRKDHMKVRALLAEAQDEVDREALLERHLLEISNVFLAHHAHEETHLYRWARERATAK